MRRAHRFIPDAPEAVIPAHAGIQFVDVTILKIHLMNNLDSGIRRNDGIFVVDHHVDAVRYALMKTLPLRRLRVARYRIHLPPPVVAPYHF